MRGWTCPVVPWIQLGRTQVDPPVWLATYIYIYIHVSRITPVNFIFTFWKRLTNGSPDCRPIEVCSTTSVFVRRVCTFYLLLWRRMLYSTVFRLMNACLAYAISHLTFSCVPPLSITILPNAHTGKLCCLSTYPFLWAVLYFVCYSLSGVFVFWTFIFFKNHFIITMFLFSVLPPVYPIVFVWRQRITAVRIFGILGRLM